MPSLPFFLLALYTCDRQYGYKQQPGLLWFSSLPACSFLNTFRTIGTALPRGSLSPNSFTSWNTSFSVPNNTVNFDDGSIARNILVSVNVRIPEISGLVYGCGCGFICYNQSCNSFLFATFVLYYDEYCTGTVYTDLGPHVVWSANPNNPVSANATLQFASERGLVLRNAAQIVIKKVLEPNHRLNRK